jgi:hypothetical protein
MLIYWTQTPVHLKDDVFLLTRVSSKSNKTTNEFLKKNYIILE